MNITVQVTEKRVSDLLFGHGGSYSIWLHTVKGNLLDGATVKFDRADEQEGTGSGNLKLSYGKMQRGLAVMAQKEPKAFADFMAENDDDLTFDVAWQCIIFGKTIYG